jgi:hypothetical protein
MLRASPEASAGPSMPNLGQIEQMVATIGQLSHETDWRRPITEYLQLAIIPDDEVGNPRLTRMVKGYLIHDRELY